MRQPEYAGQLGLSVPVGIQIYSILDINRPSVIPTHTGTHAFRQYLS
jgi:hypothetical protein